MQPYCHIPPRFRRVGKRQFQSGIAPESLSLYASKRDRASPHFPAQDVRDVPTEIFYISGSRNAATDHTGCMTSDRQYPQPTPTKNQHLLPGVFAFDSRYVYAITIVYGVASWISLSVRISDELVNSLSLAHGRGYHLLI